MSVAARLFGEGAVLWVAVALFGLTYVGLLLFAKYRAYIALGFGALFVLFGILPAGEVLPSVNFNVIMMMAGTMGAVTMFIESGMPAKMADTIIDKAPNLKWTTICLSIFSGVISAFVDNTATVLMVAPVAVGVSKKLKVSPVPIVIAISIASNLQGAATLVGDTTSILLGGAANMNFMDFFFFQPAYRETAGIGLFFIVQLAFLAATAFLYYVFRDQNQKLQLEERTVVQDYFPTVLLTGIVLTLIAASFLPDQIALFGAVLKKPEMINGYICMGYFIAGVIYYLLVKKNTNIVVKSFQEMDYFTLLLLTGLFVVIGGLVKSGAIDLIGQGFAALSGGNVFVIYTILVWFSVLVSAFVDNIPYVATMLPVVTVIARTLGVEPYLLYFGLLSGATLGGNLTPIGASANIASLGILRKEGYEVKASEFMKMSIPYTLTAVMVGYVLIWFLWK